MKWKAVVVVVALAGLLAGQPVPAAGAPRTGNRVLVVVDIQEDCTGSILKPPFLFQQGSERFIGMINHLVTRAGAAQVPVVYLRTNLKMEDGPGARLDRRLKVVGTDTFLKDSLDAFASSNHLFADFLAAHGQITEIDLVGLDAMLCVFETARAAVKRGYVARVVMDAVLTVSGKSPRDIQAIYRKAGIQPTTMAALLRAF